MCCVCFNNPHSQYYDFLVVVDSLGLWILVLTVGSFVVFQWFCGRSGSLSWMTGVRPADRLFCPQQGGGFVCFEKLFLSWGWILEFDVSPGPRL